MDDLKLCSKSEKALDSLIQRVRMFSEVIGMQFQIDKYAMLVIKRRSDCIQSPNDEVIKSLEEGESYKYLGVLEADEVMVNERKDKVKKEYFRRVKKVLETKLNSGNVFKAINTWTVSVVRYPTAFLGWSRIQLEEIGRRTRHLLTMLNGFHPRGNVDRLYISRSVGGRRLVGVQETVQTAILGLRNYVRNSKERLLIAARTIREDEDRETPNKYKNRKNNERKTQWTQKQLHGQFISQKMGKANEYWWGWLRRRCIKRTTEVLIIVAQEQAVRTKNIKAKIDKTQ